ncbi:HET-domain-containing protein [Xylariaceae sp. FL0594]|nr:HET-domain-containing protein [Xylariaceae sp. FL0594]
MSEGDSAMLCDFCKSTDWKQLTTGVFNPQKAPLENGQCKHGEHNLGVIRSNEGKCELCRMIGRASRTLKPWWPIGEFLDRPERITCAFFTSRNRLGHGPLNTNISQRQFLLDQFYAEQDPKFSSTNLILRQFLDALSERGVTLDGQSRTDGDGRKNSSLNRLLVLAGLAPVKFTSQTFMQLHPCPYPLPTVADYTTADPPSSAFPSGRQIGSNVNVDLLKNWYNTCLDDHGSPCDQPAWLVPVRAWPKGLRLIDVRQRCIVDAPTPCVYFALSYVWGQEQDPLQSTRQNLASLREPGALESWLLPRTIEDALWLTSAMGTGYLWIDRLCVVQDSDADKAVQLPQMDLIFSSAAVTIVAASGAAKDGLSGIAGTPREISQSTARVAQDLSLMDVLWLDRAYQDCAWRTRGWTFQEGLCSRRSLVITQNQVFWSCETAKCCETIAFEDFPTAVRPGDLVYQVLSGHEVFGEFGGANNFSYAELGAMIKAYNQRVLSYEADALNAFAGVLSRVVASNPGHEFHWGHAVVCMFDLSLAWVNIVWNYDAEVAAQKVKVAARRRGMHRLFYPTTTGDGSYEVPIPSWSWLGWMHLEGITRVIPKQVVDVRPELNIMKLDVHGKAAPLLRVAPGAPPLANKHKVDMGTVDASTSAGWKGDTAIPPHQLHANAGGGEQENLFLDSGRLLFWTSHAVLRTKGGKIYASSSSSSSSSAGTSASASDSSSSLASTPEAGGTVDGKRNEDRKGKESGNGSEDEREIGELLPFRQHQLPRPDGPFSFVVVSRKMDDYRGDVVRAEHRLYLLLVEWLDREARVAERLYAAEVDEDAWVAEEREWILLTLA